jgi:hypothetical protein
MKALLLSFLFLFTLHSQTYYYKFSGLSGLEDVQNNTHLYYRLYTFIPGGGPISDKEFNSIYHLNLSSNSDTLFLFHGGSIGESYTSISEYKFYNNNPAKYIYAGEWTSVDPVAFIKKYNKTDPLYQMLGEMRSLQISQQDENLIFANVPYLIKTTDEGLSWGNISNDHLILSISPYNHNTIFYNFENKVLKTTDGGSSLFIVDTNAYSTNFYYDKDSMHIYALSRDKKQLFISNNKGEPFSWSRKYSGTSEIFISIDYSQSGVIYLADGKNILRSANYGLTFQPYFQLERKIVGIYKKSGSNLLYAATSHKLYEIDGNNASVIKQLDVNPDLFNYYPLAVGNRWFYKQTCYDWDFPPTIQVSYYQEYIPDKITMGNGKTYYEINGTQLFYERIDSSEGKVYRYDTGFPGDEKIIIDFSLEPNDTIFDVGYFSYPGIASTDLTLIGEGTDTSVGYTGKYKEYLELFFTSTYTYKLMRNIGMTYISASHCFNSCNTILYGAIINGVIYGDTTTLSVDDRIEKPALFSLSQNYPNPFNPSTKIKFTIPDFGFTTLKIYDVLGNEITILVNEEKQPGEYEVEFSVGSFGDGSKLSSGVYFYQLRSGGFVKTNKMILMK